MNGTPVRPSWETSVSASPAAADPPNAYSTLRPLDAGIGQRQPRRVRSLLEAGHGVAAERVHPGTDDEHVSAFDHLGHYSQTM